MRFYVRNGLGDGVDSPSVEDLRRFLRELDPTDEEHGAAWVSTHDGKTLEWNVDGRLVYAGREVTTRYMSGIAPERALELWLVLIAGHLDELENCPWQPGSRPPRTAAEEAALRRLLVSVDREFYTSLGDEREDVPCRRAGCVRGSVIHSVLCRPHHFESVRGKPSPFDD